MEKAFPYNWPANGPEIMCPFSGTIEFKLEKNTTVFVFIDYHIDFCHTHPNKTIQTSLNQAEYVYTYSFWKPILFGDAKVKW